MTYSFSQHREAEAGEARLTECLKALKAKFPAMTVSLVVNCFLSYLLNISISSKLLGQFGNIITPYRDTFILTQMVIANGLLSTVFIIQQNVKKLCCLPFCLLSTMSIGHQALVGFFTYHVIEEEVYFW
mgnify:CR=1 FL=1